MKNKALLITVTLVSLALASCTVIKKEAYFNRGQPESLLDVSNEEVAIDLNRRDGFPKLNEAISKQSPSNAYLVCSNSMICSRAEAVLNKAGVRYNKVSGVANSVSLSFTNIVARDCENRFISNHINPYNLNHPTFGCSMAVNQVQMVSDKRQFTDPLVLGPYDGKKAVQNYDTYQSREPAAIEVISSTSGGK